MHSTGLTDGSDSNMSADSESAADIWRVIDSVTSEKTAGGGDDETGSRHRKKWWRRTT